MYEFLMPKYLYVQMFRHTNDHVGTNILDRSRSYVDILVFTYKLYDMI